MCATALMVGGSLLGGLIQSNSANKATKAQTSAANSASAAQVRAAKNATAVQKHYAFDAINSLQIGRRQTEDFYNQARDNVLEQADATAGKQLNVLNPYNNTAAREALDYELGVGTRPTDYLGYQASPGYEFQRDEGLRALESTKAGQGLLFSGAAMKEAQRLGNGLAAQDYGNHLSRLESSANSGQQAAGAMANAYGNWGTTRANALGTFGAASAENQANYYNNSAQTRVNLGNSMANSYMGVGNALATGYQAAGNAQAAGAIASGNAFSSGINNALGGYMYMQGANPASSAIPGGSSFTGLY